MSPNALTRFAGALALASALLLTVAAAPPKPNAAATAYTPRFEAVAETRLLMEALAQPNYRGLEKLLADGPADADHWAFARGQGLLLAETGNLLLIRPPRDADARDAWFRRAVDLRDKAAALARQTGRQDLDASRAALVDVAAACNRCHQTFRVAVRVGPAARPPQRGAD